MQILNKFRRLYYEWKYRRMIRQRSFEHKSIAQIFTETHAQRYWKSKETASGAGSELHQTKALRSALPLLLRQYKIEQLIDLPCGDFNWIQHTDLEGIHYIGADIVPALIEQNIQQYGRPDRQFMVCNLLEDNLPQGSCILVRDCLVHFSYLHIGAAVRNLKRSGIRYLLTTSFTDLDVNSDIITGFWRPINLMAPPFCFPPPLYVLSEECTEGQGAYGDKSLLLWEIENLPDFRG